MPMNPLEALKLARKPQPELEAQLGLVTQSIVPMLPQRLLGPLKGLSEASHRIAPVVETLGETHPDFTPVGGEGLYNVAKTGLSTIMDPAEAAYHQLLSRFGR